MGSHKIGKYTEIWVSLHYKKDISIPEYRARVASRLSDFPGITLPDDQPRAKEMQELKSRYGIAHEVLSDNPAGFTEKIGSDSYLVIARPDRGAIGISNKTATNRSEIAKKDAR